jgi:cytochrome oxidase assembly protein ShyY1
VSVWRLAATRRWIGILGFTLAFAAVCVGLGQWQFDRRATAQAAIALLDQNYAIATAPLSEVVEAVDEFDASEKWRSVRIVGEYDPETLYVRTRSGAGGIGFEQLAMLKQSDGTVFVVNRGWVPANGDNSAPAETPPLPAGTVTATAHLMPGEQQVLGRNAPAGQIATIHLAAIDELYDGDVFGGWYGRVAIETPAADTGSAWVRPVLGEGPHLSYALQWYVFAAMGFFGYGWALRKEHRGDVAPTPKVRKRISDEDIEDQALDAR